VAPLTAELLRLVNGYQASQAIHVAATLGIADLLADGARSSDDVAEAAGADPDALYRLLRALAALGVLHEEDGRRFSLTELGDGLRSDAPQSVAGWAAYIGRPAYWQAWGALLHSVRTGETAFPAVHGTDVWDYRAHRPEDSAAFDRAMTASTRTIDAAVVEAYDFGRYGTIVDVGGGRGALLAALLRRHPAMQGVLFDRPHVVAEAVELLEEAGVADRCRIKGGSFFDGVPAGADAYLLKSIVHDWEDPEATAILERCRAAIGDRGGALLLVERDLGPPNEVPAAKLSDLNMLVAPGGRERTQEEYAALLAASGFAFAGATAAGVVNVIEARPV
jgi:hypothetical protein